MLWKYEYDMAPLAAVFADIKEKLLTFKCKEEISTKGGIYRNGPYYTEYGEMTGVVCNSRGAFSPRTFSYFPPLGLHYSCHGGWSPPPPVILKKGPGIQPSSSLSFFEIWVSPTYDITECRSF